MHASWFRMALVLAAISFASSACTSELGEAPPEGEGMGAGLAAYDVDPASLRRGRRELLVEGPVAAENQLFTSSGRLLISGDEGIFELLREAGRSRLQPLIKGEACAFGGLTELAGTVYANCYDMTNSAIYAARLTDKPTFKRIHELRGVALANGLTSDGKSSLYVANTFEGKILRLRVKAEDPLAIQAQETFLEQSGLATNGIKYFGGQLVWSMLTQVKSVQVRDDGSAGPARTLGSALTLFDDLYADASGVVVADYLNGSLVALDRRGGVVSSTRAYTFDGPSSVLPANGRLGLPQDALVVTERNANRVSLLLP